MRRIIFFTLLLTATNLLSQIPDSLEVTLPWEVIYVSDCSASSGAKPTSTNDDVFISDADVKLEVEDANGVCYKKFLEYTILDWKGGTHYTFTQLVRVDDAFILEGVSDITITYDELPYAIEVNDLLVDPDPLHTYSFDPFDQNAVNLNFEAGSITGGVSKVYIYDHDDMSVVDVNVLVTDCEDDVVFDLPNTAIIEFSGEDYISFSEELLGVNIVYPCSDFDVTIKSGNLDGVFAGTIGETILVDVKVKTNVGSGTQTLFTGQMTVTITGEGVPPVPMFIEEKTFEAGEEVTLDIWTDQLEGLAAWQLRLNFENAEILELEEGPSFDDIPHNIFNDGKTINTIWLPADVQSIDVPANDTWFTLTVLPSIDGSTFDIFTTENDPWSEIVLEDSTNISGVNADFSFQIEERSFLVANEEVESSQVQIFNNPVTDVLIIDGVSTDLEFDNLLIVSMDGRVVLEEDVVNKNDNLVVDVARLKTGVYVLVLSDDKNIQTTKFVKI